MNKPCGMGLASTGFPEETKIQKIITGEKREVPGIDARL